MLGITDINKESHSHLQGNTLYHINSSLWLTSPYLLYMALHALLEGRRGSLVALGLGGEDFLKPVLIEIDNCAEMSSGDGCWDEFITEPSDRSLSEHFS